MENKIIKAHMKGSPQGDIFLLKIDSLPQKATLRTGENANVLALGEVTGHNHVIEGAEIYTLEDQLFVKVGKTAVLTHGGVNPDVDFDHYRQEYVAGVYVVLQQRTEENDPMAD